MKAVFYICITSGARGPELDLTEEQLKPILELSEGLTQPWDGSKFAGHGLGADHYSVHWEDDDGTHYGLMTESSGFVRIWRKGDTDWTQYRDTVGLWAHLAQYGGPAHQQWIEDSRKQAEEYQKWLKEQKDAGNEPIISIPISAIFNVDDP